MSSTILLLFSASSTCECFHSFLCRRLLRQPPTEDWSRHSLFCTIPLVSEDRPNHFPVNSVRAEEQNQPSRLQQQTQDEPQVISLAHLEVAELERESFIALYFPVNDEHPRVVPVSCTSLKSSSLRPQPDVTSFLPLHGGFLPHDLILHQGLGCRLRYPFHIWYCPGATITNSAIYRLTAGRAVWPWKGDVLVLKFSGSRKQVSHSLLYIIMPLNLVNTGVHGRFSFRFAAIGSIFYLSK